MNMVRTVVLEPLDSLPEDHPAALRSRRDLRRVHRAMGTQGILLRALGRWRAPCAAQVPLRLLELGAGDGTVMLGVAQALKAHWPAVELTLLDRQRLVTPATLAAYARLGWSASMQVADVLDWAVADSSPRPARLLSGMRLSPTCSCITLRAAYWPPCWRPSKNAPRGFLPASRAGRTWLW
ncbi:MAG: hypothetical protein H7273_02985, partial [Polaromonas sp.]|nr:hypothetical protein [Polaromonas sp.]